MLKMKTINFNRLTQEEQQKLATITKMLLTGLPEFIAETDVLEEQIAFIRKHAGKNYLFYSEGWYMENPRRTKSIYYTTRNKYTKEYAVKRKIFQNAAESAKKLLAKASEELVSQ